MLSIEESEDPAPGPQPADPETGRFTPALCAGGNPGDPACPVNLVDLGELEATGSFGFVLQAVGGGLYVNRPQITAGTSGLYLEHPTLRFWSSPGGPPMERAFDTTLNLPPGTTSPLDGGTSAFVGASLDAISLRFAAIGPYRP